MNDATKQLVKVLEYIANQDPVENILDPQWSARLAKAALAEHRQQEKADRRGSYADHIPGY